MGTRRTGKDASGKNIECRGKRSNVDPPVVVDRRGRQQHLPKRAAVIVMIAAAGVISVIMRRMARQQLHNVCWHALRALLD